jgi:BirA family biotin operon repressor/biotin-[acetyl-CoA-carboxylase] ligase
LTEAVTDFESGTVESIIAGIGINVKTREEDFPHELKAKATSVFSGEEGFALRNRLAAEIINNILSSCENLDKKEFLKEYKDRSLILGKQITYTKNSQLYEAQAKDIDSSGGLVIESSDGRTEILHSGEVSIKTY